MPRFLPSLGSLLTLSQYKIVNILCFKLLWFILVVFQNDLAIPSIIVLFILSLLHPDKKHAWKSFFGIALLGIAIDSMLSLSGIFIFDVGFLIFPIPLWLMLLWCAFAMTLPYGFSFIAKYAVFLQALIGALASFSYLIGRNLGAVNYEYSVLITQLVLVFIWGFLLPLYFNLTKKRATLNVVLD